MWKKSAPCSENWSLWLHYSNIVSWKKTDAVLTNYILSAQLNRIKLKWLLSHWMPIKIGRTPWRTSWWWDSVSEWIRPGRSSQQGRQISAWCGHTCVWFPVVLDVRLDNTADRLCLLWKSGTVNCRCTMNLYTSATLSSDYDEQGGGG